MPISPTYPGVYIEEVPSGVRTITGVATSITAFIGSTLRGPVNQAITINSFGDFERIYGGLSLKSTVSYAVRDFYLNGGSQGIIVRLFRPYFATEADRTQALDAAQDVAGAAIAAAAVVGATPTSVKDAARNQANLAENSTEPRKSAADTVAKAAEVAEALAGATANSVGEAATAAVGQAAPITKARLSVNTLNLEAANEGSWGNKLRARIDHDVKGEDAANLFNLSIKDTGTGQIEVFRNLSVQAGHPRQVNKVLEQESQLVRVRGTLPTTRPGTSPTVPPGGDSFSNTNSTGVQSTDQASDGQTLTISEYSGSRVNKQGIYALEQADLFNLLCIPPYSFDQDITPTTLWDTAATYCQERRAMLLVDPPSTWKSKNAAKGDGTSTGVAAVGTNSKNAALYFPRLLQPNPLRDNQVEAFVPCGAVAGVMSRTDAQRGVWKAPAGLDATLVGVPQLEVPLTDPENGELNPLGINCLRSFPAAGRVIWGARTLQGDDRLASEWKYVPVRRTALFIEESLYRGLKWVVFEPNDEPLWAQIRLNVGAFMNNLFRQGAFQGKTPREAYLVKCDKETTTQNDINLGIVNILVGFAPLKPAEFVIIKIQQLAGQITT
ncbi:phage tail sheath C-terminal domain-containing protein [Brasilonema sp. UFV-L1]|uniref:phage tail sheath family protein n=1 Tax=Brasilonema sp. UFV-L1 TaxID=2234130 RepID=UPI00145F9264|nr:phage tail sheath C-terminal domain-containing protein [Brasilonema sp. UFV-L1]NMG11108.1 phage tail sheath family protein [Brasilonema sp. UFV-L1]